MITAEEFSIKVKADCKKLLSDLQKVNGLIKDSKEESGELEEEMVSGAQKIGNAIGTFIGKSIITIINLAKKLGSVFLNIAKSIGSGIIRFITAPFRAIKNILTGIAKIGKKILDIVVGSLIWKNVNKSIGELNEGLEDAYNYSVLIDSSLSRALDKISSKGAYLKSAFGALSGVLLQGLEPIINTVFEWLADLINKLSKLLAEMFALPEYLVANKDIMKQWADNNKQTKQLISGLDELNMFKSSTDTALADMYSVKKTDTSSPNYGALTSVNKFFSWFADTALPSIKNWWTGDVLPALQTIWTNFSIWWQGTAKPALAQWWQERAKPAILNLWDDIKNKIMPRLHEWFYGVRQEDEDENGNTIIRIVEPGFIDKVKSYISTIINWFKDGWDTIKTTLQDIWEFTIKPVIMAIGTMIKEGMLAAWNESIQPALANFWKTTVGDPIVSKQLEDSYEHTGKMESWTGLWRWIFPTEIGKYIGEKISQAAGWGIYSDKYKDLRPNALGGVYTSPTAVLVGEASTYSNPELITPTALLDSRLQANNQNLISAWAQMTQQIIGAINSVDMSVNIGDDTIANSANRYNLQYYKMTGKSLIN